jgi:hypothetical protein
MLMTMMIQRRLRQCHWPQVKNESKDMKLKNPENKNQIHDWNTWCPGASIGEIINSPINPVLYEY